MKKCKRCKVLKNIKEFCHKQASKDKLDYWCKECHKKYEELNKEKIAKRHRKTNGKRYWENLEESRKKARECYAKNKSSQWRLRFEILKRDSFTCQYCGRKAPDVELHVDHKYPKSKGGLSIKGNYITACMECNIGKSDIF